MADLIYTLKFGAAWLLPPGLFILLIIGASLHLWRRGGKAGRKAARWLFILDAAFYILCCPLAADFMMSTLERQYEFSGELTGDSVIMLGGGAVGDAKDIDGMGNLGGHASGRLLTAARIERTLGVPIILSGGQVFADSGEEAHIAKRILLGLGVAEDKIIVEDRSINTKQNALYSAEILKEHNLKKPILVTSAFHMARSVLNFEKAGVAVNPVPTDYIAAKNRAFYFNRLAPSAGSFSDSVMVLRELLAIFVAKYIW